MSSKSIDERVQETNVHFSKSQVSKRNNTDALFNAFVERYNSRKSAFKPVKSVDVVLSDSDDIMMKKPKLVRKKAVYHPYGKPKPKLVRQYAYYPVQELTQIAASLKPIDQHKIDEKI